jgi:Protein of unknown function (DUF1759)
LESIQEPALTEIKHLAITHSNYDIAIATLKANHDKPEESVISIFVRILNAQDNIGLRYDQLFAAVTMLRGAQGCWASMPPQYTTRENLIAQIIRRKFSQQLAHAYFQIVPKEKKTDLQTLIEFLSSQTDYYKNSSSTAQP